MLVFRKNIQLFSVANPSTLPMTTTMSAHRFYYSFTGKEKDSETGYYYFGARYYNPDLSLWLSVDPMADKYPSLSPYNYCAWNPMKLVDPDGAEMDEWKIDLKGNVVDRKANDIYDIVKIVDDNGNILSTGCQFEKGTISELMLSNKEFIFDVCGDENAKDLFEYFADFYTEGNGHPLEWGHSNILGSDDERNFVGTSHEESRERLVPTLMGNGYQVVRSAHNHPSGDGKPSGSVNPPILDLGLAAKYPNINFSTYVPGKGYVRYNENGVIYMNDINIIFNLKK